MGLCKRAKTICYSGCLAPSPDAGSLPLLLMIMKLVCVWHATLPFRFAELSSVVHLTRI